MHKLLKYHEANNRLSSAEKVGQLFMPAAFINDTEEEILRLEQLIQEQGVGGLCFFHSRASAATNYEDTPPVGQAVKKVIYNEHSFDTLKSLIERYQAAAKYPLLIAIDAEWGLAMRIENTPQYPYAITLGAIAEERTDLIYEVAKNIAQDCRKAGIQWNLAPCVDINNNPGNPVIGYRSFGEDASKVAQNALAFIRGTQSEGILTSIKHFPGHGDTATDSHLELPLIDKSKQELLQNELRPFQELIHEGVDSVMIGHLSVPNLANGNTISSSLSKEIIKGVLRDEMGYMGVVISDALNMHAVAKNYPIKGELEWLAFDAGNDVLCFAEHILEGIETILTNASEEQIEESFKRVWQLKEKVHDAVTLDIERHSSNLPTGKTGSNSNTGSNSDLILKSPDELNRKIAVESITLLKGLANINSNFIGNNFIGIHFSEKSECQFFKYLYPNIKFKSSSWTDDSIKDSGNILLALFPPQVKPTNSFGFSKEELICINKLMETKNVVLYVFGNPYVLNHFDFEKAKAIVIAYQDFEAFQEVAAEHFLGNLEAKGKLPVTLSP